MGKNKKPVDLEKSKAAFDAKLASMRASKAQRVTEVRADFDVAGFCKHGIPAHCPHGCGK